jgi:hypothetical protein
MQYTLSIAMQLGAAVCRGKNRGEADKAARHSLDKIPAPF